MLLACPVRKPQRSIRIGSSAAPTGAVGGPSFSRYVQPVFRTGQGAFTTVAALRRSTLGDTPALRVGVMGEPAIQYDFSTVDGSQEAGLPKFGRWMSWLVPTQRFTRPVFSRYPDLYAEWEYPAFAFHQNAQRSTTAASMARTGGFVRQTDFAIRRRKYRSGPRPNGLLMAFQVATIPAQYRPAAAYYQERGFNIVWTPSALFPTQYGFLFARKTGSTIGLCVVATGDAPTGMGGQIRVNHNGTNYAVYLVDTADSNASPVRVNTTAGVKSIRLKT